MLKNMTLILLSLIFISACGGGGGGSKKSSSSSVAMVSSSKAASSTAAMSSSLVASSVVSSVQSSASSASVITLQAGTWVANNGAQLSLNTQGVTLALTQEYQGAKYTYDPATSLKNSVIKAVVSVDSTFKASGADLQLFAFVDQDPWPGQENCPVVVNAELTVGTDITISCVLDKDIFNQTAINIGFGVQAVLPTAGSPVPDVADAPRPLSGTITIKSARIELGDPNASSSSSSSSSGMSSSMSSTSNGIVTIATTDLYFTGDTQAGQGSISHGVNGATVDIAANYTGAGFTLNPAFTGMRNGSVEFLVNVSQEFKTSGAGLVIYIYQTQAPYDGKACETTGSAALTVGEDKTISCALDLDIFDESLPIEFKLSAIPNPSMVDGTFLIKSARVVLATTGGTSSSASAPSSAASSSSSSVPMSSSSTSANLSSSAISSSESSSSSMSSEASSFTASSSNAIALQASTWQPNASAQVSLNMQGVLVLVNDQYQGAKYSYDPAESVENAVVEVVVDVDSAFKASGAGLQLFANVDAAPWTPQGGCLITPSADLVVDGEATVSCALTHSSFNQTAANVNIGIQATPGGSPVAGTFTIKSARILPADSSSSSSSAASSSSVASSSSSSAQNVVLTLDPTASTFYGKDNVSVTKLSNGAKVTYAADWDAAAFWVTAGSAAIENHTIEIDFQASPQFKASGGSLYIYTIFNASPWTSESDCSWFMNANIVADTPQTITCTVSSSGAFSQTAIPIEIRLLARGTANGDVLVTGGRVIAP